MNARGLSVQCEQLSIGRDGEPLLRGLDLQVAPGEILALLGPSGTGKSTLLDTIEGRLDPLGGRLERLDPSGRKLGLRASARRLARVEQDLLLADALSLEQNVLLGRLPRYAWWQTFVRFPRAEREAARQLLAELGLGHLWWKPAAAVSGGERQRTALARALFAEPELLLADEPTASLDAETAEHALRVVREHMRSGSTLIVLHDRELAQRHADRVLDLGDLR